MVVGATVGATVVSFDGPGVGVVGAPTARVVFTGVGLTAGLGVEPEPTDALVVADAAAAEAIALTSAGSAEVDAAAAGDEMGALGNALVAAAAAGPDDAPLLLCDELEHPERASAATTVTPINPVRRIRTVTAFPPAGMRPTIDDAIGCGVAFAELRQVPPDLSTASVARSILLGHLDKFSLGRTDNKAVTRLRLAP